MEERIVERREAGPLAQSHDRGVDQAQDEKARVSVSCVPAVSMRALDQRVGSLQRQAFEGAKERRKLFAIRAGKGGIELLAALALPGLELGVALGECLFPRALAAGLSRAAPRLDRRRDLPRGEVEVSISAHGGIPHKNLPCPREEASLRP